MRPRLPLPVHRRIAVAGALLASFQIKGAQAAPPIASDTTEVADLEAAGATVGEAAAPSIRDLSGTPEAAPDAVAASYAAVAAEAKSDERDGRYVEALDTWGRLAQDPSALTPAQRTEWEEATDRLTALTRGRAEDDPASTQREVLDFQRSGAERSAPTPLDTTAPAPTSRSNRVVHQWYFWVAASLIAVSVGTIAGLAIQSATAPGGVDGRAGVAAPPPGPPAALVRF
jgi:hypothetical protein